MKLKEIYSNKKMEYPQSIILIKSGNFYITYYEDSLIINELLNYQIVNNKVGFPIGSLDKVIKLLESKEINYIIIEQEEIVSYNSNYSIEYYNKLLSIAKKRGFNDSSNELLLNRIKYLINDNKGNYTKIKNFIDEL